VKRFDSADAIKGLAIIAVIALHVNLAKKPPIYFGTITQAVPLFFVQIGFVSALYFQKDFSIGKYYITRCVRIFLPIYFLIPFVLLSHYLFLNKNSLPLVPFWLIGYMKEFWWGGYFITCYIQWALLLPIIYLILKDRGYLLHLIIIAFFMLHAAAYLNKSFIIELLPTTQKSWAFRSLIITYLPHISLGMAFGTIIGKTKLKAEYLYLSISLLMVIFLYKYKFISSRDGWYEVSSFTLDRLLSLDISIFYPFFIFSGLSTKMRSL